MIAIPITSVERSSALAEVARKIQRQSSLSQAQPDVLKTGAQGWSLCIPFLIPAFNGTAPRGRDSIAQGASPGKMKLTRRKPQRGEITEGELGPINKRISPRWGYSDFCQTQSQGDQPIGRCHALGCRI